MAPDCKGCVGEAGSGPRGKRKPPPGHTGRRAVLKHERWAELRLRFGFGQGRIVGVALVEALGSGGVEGALVRFG